MKNVHPVLGFELMTFGTQVSSHNHFNKAPALLKCQKFAKSGHTARVRKETKRMGEEVAAAAAHQHIKRCLFAYSDSFCLPLNDNNFLHFYSTLKTFCYFLWEACVCGHQL